MCFAGKIALPITTCANRMKSLAEGELQAEVPVDNSLEEVGVLTNATAELTTCLKTLIGDIDEVLNQLSMGDFTVNSKCGELYVGDFASIVTSMDGLKAKLSATLSSIQEAANQVMLGSNQMSQSAQDLAVGAAEQTDSINSLRNTIINVTMGVEQNAVQSKAALDKVEEVKQVTVESNKEMNRMTDAMQRISNTSMEIANIVAEIESIASQTNLLSLNASIEAARAGEAGKGFAVVAEEIRKLAESSSQSAMHTKELIDAAVAEVENGNQITANTATALGKVIEGLEEISTGASISTESSIEQAEAMKKVEDEIKQITDVVQNNSATAQESSATSEELSAQAIGLNELIGEFTIQ